LHAIGFWPALMSPADSHCRPLHDALWLLLTR